MRLSACKNNDELHGSKLVVIDDGYLKQMGLPDGLGGNIFLGGWLENGTAWEEAWVPTATAVFTFR